MDEYVDSDRPNYMPALAFVGILVGFQNLAIQADTQPDPFTRPALSVTQAFRLPPEMQPAEREEFLMEMLTEDDGPDADVPQAFWDDKDNPNLMEDFLRAAVDVEDLAQEEVPPPPEEEDAATPALPVIQPPPEAPTPPPPAPAPAPAERVETILRAAKSAPKAPAEKLPTPKTYQVRRGDTLSKIARRFDKRLSDLVVANSHLANIHALSPGTKIFLEKNQVIEHKVQAGESLWSISRSFNISVSEIVLANNLSDRNIFVNQVLKLPVKSSQTAAIARAKSAKKARFFDTPVEGRLTDRFGMRWHPINRRRTLHRGQDFAAPRGTLIQAAADGQVKRAAFVQGYGFLVELRHRNGYITRYGHCSKLLVQKGEWVRKGDPIAKVGSTGLSTAPHLHFEIRKNGVPKDPMKYLGT